jgi:hypothetical protein
VVTSFRDRTDDVFNGRFYAAVSGRTKAFVGYRQVEIDYDRDTIGGDTLNSEESTVLAGVEWEVTGKTVGSLEIGRLEKDFDSSRVDGDDLTVWNLGLQWSPRSYSTISLNSSRDAAETNGTGAYIEQSTYSVSWSQDWSERLHSTISIAIRDDEYPGSSREDDREDYTIGLDYDWLRWLNVGLRLQETERDSNIDVFDFSRSRVYITVDLSL